MAPRFLRPRKSRRDSRVQPINDVASSLTSEWSSPVLVAPTYEPLTRTIPYKEEYLTRIGNESQASLTHKEGSMPRKRKLLSGLNHAMKRVMTGLKKLGMSSRVDEDLLVTRSDEYPEEVCVAPPTEAREAAKRGGRDNEGDLMIMVQCQEIRLNAIFGEWSRQQPLGLIDRETSLPREIAKEMEEYRKLVIESGRAIRYIEPKEVAGTADVDVVSYREPDMNDVQVMQIVKRADCAPIELCYTDGDQEVQSKDDGLEKSDKSIIEANEGVKILNNMALADQERPETRASESDGEYPDDGYLVNRPSRIESCLGEEATNGADEALHRQSGKAVNDKVGLNRTLSLPSGTVKMDARLEFEPNSAEDLIDFDSNTNPSNVKFATKGLSNDALTHLFKESFHDASCPRYSLSSSRNASTGSLVHDELVTHMVQHFEYLNLVQHTQHLQ